MHTINFRTVKTLVATGNTYAFRSKLRELGFSWDEDGKKWVADVEGLAYNRKASIKAALYPMTQKGVNITGS